MNSRKPISSGAASKTIIESHQSFFRQKKINRSFILASVFKLSNQI